VRGPQDVPESVGRVKRARQGSSVSFDPAAIVSLLGHEKALAPPRERDGEGLAFGLDRLQQLGLGGMGETGEQTFRLEVALHAAEERVVDRRERQRREVEALARPVGEHDLSGLEVDLPHEEARLLDLDLASEMLESNDVLPVLGQVGDMALEMLPQLPIADRLPLVAESPVVMEHETEGPKGRGPGSARSGAHRSHSPAMRWSSAAVGSRSSSRSPRNIAGSA
jgi:hypothetical protein